MAWLAWSLNSPCCLSCFVLFFTALFHFVRNLQEHKRDIAKRAQPSPAQSLHCSSFLDFQFTKYFLGKLGYSRKNPRSRGWGYTFLLTFMTPLGNSKLENQARPTSFLVDLQEFPYALSSIALEILWIANYGMTALEVS